MQGGGADTHRAQAVEGPQAEGQDKIADKVEQGGAAGTGEDQEHPGPGPEDRSANGEQGLGPEGGGIIRQQNRRYPGHRRRHEVQNQRAARQYDTQQGQGQGQEGGQQQPLPGRMPATPSYPRLPSAGR